MDEVWRREKPPSSLATCLQHRAVSASTCGPFLKTRNGNKQSPPPGPGKEVKKAPLRFRSNPPFKQVLILARFFGAHVLKASYLYVLIYRFWCKKLTLTAISFGFVR